MPVDAIKELDELHNLKAKLLLSTTYTINMAQLAIQKSLKLSKEIKKITGGQRD